MSCDDALTTQHLTSPMRVSSDKNNDKTFNQVNTMKTNLIKHSVAGLAVAALLGSASVALGEDKLTDTKDLNLGGLVYAVNTLAITPVAPYSALDLTAGYSSWTKVAEVVETSNCSDGYTVTMESLNLNASSHKAQLSNGETTPKLVEYTIRYGGTVTVDFNVIEHKAVLTSVTAPTGAEGASKDVEVKITANAWPEAGTYADKLTLTITAL